MRMPGQTWAGAAATFLGMWIVMMVAMMLPSLIPMLQRYRKAAGGTAGAQLGPLTAIVGAAYFFMWTLFGVAAFPLGVALATVEMREPSLSRAVPLAAGVVVLVAGAEQFTEWKARHLRCCREAPGPGHTLPADAATAWRHGRNLGLHCIYCCSGLMAVLLVLGVMDLGAMALVAIALTVERVAPAGERVARGIGAALVGVGLFLIGQAVVPQTHSLVSSCDKQRHPPPSPRWTPLRCSCSDPPRHVASDALRSNEYRLVASPSAFRGRCPSSRSRVRKSGQDRDSHVDRGHAVCGRDGQRRVRDAVPAHRLDSLLRVHVPLLR
jgi:predicted metal-binding membrane protein